MIYLPESSAAVSLFLPECWLMIYRGSGSSSGSVPPPLFPPLLSPPLLLLSLVSYAISLNSMICDMKEIVSMKFKTPRKNFGGISYSIDVWIVPLLKCFMVKRLGVARLALFLI